MRSVIKASFAIFTLACCVLSGCATSGAIQTAHWHFLDGNTDAAVQVLGDAEDIAKRDQLLYWLEKGMYLHYSGDYEQSAELLLKAADFVESTDYIKLSDEAKTLLANDWAESYRGEYSEQLWIHSVQMMNFLRLGRFESAAVEARRSLEVLKRYPEPLANDHFSRALIAASFEAAGQLNDAYIVNNDLAGDVNSSAIKELAKTQSAELGFTSRGSGRTANARQHAIVFISNGLIPTKISGSILTGVASRISFPEYRFVPGGPPRQSVKIDNQPCDCLVIYSDFGKLVADSVSNRGALLATKAIARAVVKDGVADAIAEENELAGELIRILLFALEEADTRSWRSLPRHYSMIRIPLSIDAKKLAIQVGSNSHTILLPDRSEKQPLLFFSLHN